MPTSPSSIQVVLLAGGVGGAKLADGLRRVLPPEQLTIIVNTGDDFQHLGLTICPDIDTVMYTLAAVANKETGWGRAGESWQVMAEVGRLAGPDWFRLGDLDLATHLTRTHLLGEGLSLTAVTQHLCYQFGIQHPILPMSNQPAPTMIETEERLLPFQTWFVQERWQPVVKKIRLPEDVRATMPVMQALDKADIVIIAPSNPFVSIAPILNVYPIESMMIDLPKAVISVTPIIGGTAVKGPAAKMMREMGLEASATAVAQYYGDLIDGFVYDKQDSGLDTTSDIATLCVNTLMKNSENRSRLAQDVLAFALELI